MIHDEVTGGADHDGQLGSLVETASTQIRDAIGELRELGRGILPAVLMHNGLAAAVETLAALAPLPVTACWPASETMSSVPVLRLVTRADWRRWAVTSYEVDHLDVPEPRGRRLRPRRQLL